MVSEPNALPEKAVASPSGPPQTSIEFETHTGRMLEVLAPEWTTRSEVSINVRQRLIVVTEDKAHLCLQRNLDQMGRSRDWWTPAGIAISLLVTLVTTSFHDFVFPAATWQAISVIVLVGSLVWLVYTLSHRPKCPTIADVVQELQEESKKTTSGAP